MESSVEDVSENEVEKSSIAEKKDWTYYASIAFITVVGIAFVGLAVYVFLQPILENY